MGYLMCSLQSRCQRRWRGLTVFPPRGACSRYLRPVAVSALVYKVTSRCSGPTWMVDYLMLRVGLTYEHIL